MQVVFRTESSSKIGAGHAMRCLTLASALRDRGADVRFVCATLPGDLNAFIEQQGFMVERLAPLAVPEGAPSHPAWPGVPWEAEAARTRAAIDKSGARPAWIVFDHYLIDARIERQLRTDDVRIMVVDDLADRPHDCDVLLDQNLVRDLDRRYDGRVPSGTLTLLGPRFALLQPAYAELHESVAVRQGRVRRVLVFFSGADVDDLTGMAIGALRALGRADFEVDVVITASHPFAAQIRARLRDDARFNLHVNLPTLAPLMAQADLAIGASGVTSWERACLGLPSLVITMADNQRAAGDELHRAGIVRLLGHKDAVSEASLKSALAEIFDSGLDPAWSRRCAALVDGAGARRVSESLGFATTRDERARQQPHHIDSRT